MRKRVRREQPLCAHCTKPKAWTQLDHIKALTHGGTNHRSNLQGLCDDCHKAKTIKDMGYRDASCDATGNPTAPGHHWNTG